MDTRAEHLDWAKGRALAYVDAGDLRNAFASMVSDVGKHEELAGHAGLDLGMMMLLSGFLQAPRDMRQWIEGFN